MELEDRQEQLRLLALVARGGGAQGLEDYEPPSVTIAADLADPGESAASTPDDRRLEVLEFLSKAGGG